MSTTVSSPVGQQTGKLDVHLLIPYETRLMSFRLATKTKPIQAKVLSSVLADRTIASKFLLDTLEGRQAIQLGPVVVCVGAGSEVWQQKVKKLLDKYTVTDITEDGWMTCTPKPENEVWAVEFSGGSFALLAQWGEKIESHANSDLIGKFFQKGQPGDYILRSVADPNDFWIVKRSLFDSTYDFKG